MSVHVISIDQYFDKDLLAKLYKRANDFSKLPLADYPKPLQHLTLATVFFEPSTRTRLSFETAIQNLSGQLITVENAGDFSSAKKGESLEDTILTINAYADGIVMRHPQIGAAKQAAKVSRVPIINAGDGGGEHPTQALLDLYSIQQCRGKIDGLSIGLVGDLLNGRTIHSLVQLLAQYHVTIYLIAPDSLQLPAKYLKLLKSNGATIHQVDNWDKALGKVDVLYMTRVQKERFKFVEDYLAIKDSFILTPKQVAKMKKEAIILHPLPRVNEIDPAVDQDPRAKYFEQVKNGLYVRMALLEYLFKH
ncbi:MAG: carbamoyl-phosphate synthase / aspartate carbamoyltransferase / dihydroorotase [Patescibacteria group bacterium]|nr:carbamoyl-phosphate synthase / aspartate carbamoyltransferase / dihydroorotase [Patescibacteria group bacterium]